MLKSALIALALLVPATAAYTHDADSQLSADSSAACSVEHTEKNVESTAEDGQPVEYGQVLFRVDPNG